MANLRVVCLSKMLLELNICRMLLELNIAALLTREICYHHFVVR